jgi:hypothetical protein
VGTRGEGGAWVRCGVVVGFGGELARFYGDLAAADKAS